MKSIYIAEKLREKGKPVGVVDIMIAAICLNRKAKLVTRDKDFNRIKEVFTELNLEIL